jgi:predicted metal-dependent phosphoesterase TrpH
VIDLHTHTNISDGTDSPSELIQKAIDADLEIIAITDHDSTAGIAEAITKIKSQNSNIKLVPGAEISCQTEHGTSVHILGLLFDLENIQLQNAMANTRENRIGRMEKILARLRGAGIKIEMSDVLEQLADGATLGRPHLADALVKKGYFSSRDDVFAQILHNKSKYYVSHYSPTPVEAVSMIKAAGGVAVIAHPLADRRGQVIDPFDFKQLVDAGLDGIEVYHRDNNEAEQDQLIEFARKNQLAVTGSSDYHGNGKLNKLAEFVTAPEEWVRLEARANARRVIQK